MDCKERTELLDWAASNNINLTGREITCDNCDAVDCCRFRFDPYNLDGDCLASK